MIINLTVCLKRTRMRYDRCDRQSTNVLSKGAIAIIIILGWVAFTLQPGL